MADSALETVYKGWRAALVASDALVALVPAAKISIGARKSDADVPCISMTIFESTEEFTQGAKNAKIGYKENAEITMKIEIDGVLGSILLIYPQIYEVVLQQNSTLATAGVKQVKKLRKEAEFYNERGLLEGNLTFGFSYMWQIT
jgi:hypothetical protein